MGNNIPDSFYGSSVFRSGLSTFAYRAYCRARDSWIKQLMPPQDEVILDLGCSTGEALAAWAPQNFIVGFDRSASALKAARERGFVPVLGDLSLQPFRSGQFDRVVAMGIIGGADAPEPIIRLVRSLLRPDGGRALFAIAVYGGVRRFTRPLVQFLGIRNEMRHIPTVDECLQAFTTTGMRIESLATSPLFPRPVVEPSPSAETCRKAVYLFVEAVT